MGYLKYLLLYLLINIGIYSKAQNNVDLAIEYIQNYNVSDANYQDLVEQLQYFEQHPININQLKLNDVQSFPLLSSTQVLTINKYIKLNGPFLTKEELYLLPQFRKSFVDVLKPFITIKPQKYSKTKTFYIHQYNFSPEKRHGMLKSDSAGFLGNYSKQIQRLSVIKNAHQVNTSWKKDYGEKGEFHNLQQHKLNYSFTNKNSKIIIGHYNLNIGEGLIQSNQMFIDKSSLINELGVQPKTITTNTSSEAFNFETGLAAEVSLHKNIKLTSFASSNSIHGRIENDTLKSLKKDGIFRSLNDLQKLNVSKVNSLGLRTVYQNKKLEIGYNFINRKFQHVYQPERKYYNINYSLSKELYSNSLNYRWSLARINIRGEIANNFDALIAQTHHLKFSIIPEWNIGLNVRNFPYQFKSFHANTLQEYSAVNNEQGILLASQLYWENCEFLILLDHFKSAFSKYLQHGAQNGRELTSNLKIDLDDKTQLNLFYKNERKHKKSQQSTIPSASPQIKHNGYFKLKYSITDNCKVITRLDFNKYHFENTSSYGRSIYTDLIFKTEKQKFNFRVCFFDAPNWDNRIYLYEYDVLYNFSVLPYYRSGTRAYLNYGIKLYKNLKLNCKAGMFHYPDYEEIGSGDLKINTNKKSEFKVQLVYRS